MQLAQASAGTNPRYETKDMKDDTTRLMSENIRTRAEIDELYVEYDELRKAYEQALQDPVLGAVARGEIPCPEGLNDTILSADSLLYDVLREIRYAEAMLKAVNERGLDVVLEEIRERDAKREEWIAFVAQSPF